MVGGRKASVGIRSTLREPQDERRKGGIEERRKGGIEDVVIYSRLPLNREKSLVEQCISQCRSRHNGDTPDQGGFGEVG